jgi:hypothetical protein
MHMTMMRLKSLVANGVKNSRELATENGHAADARTLG